MFEKFLAEIVSEALQEAAFRTGMELGRELRSFRKVSRGEASWDELTHVQQTMFLGGDETEYERIRNQLRRSQAPPTSPRPLPRQSDPISPNADYAQLPPAFFDYGNF